MAPDSFVSAFRRENPTSVGELAEGHPLLAALCDLGIDPSVRSHSIIADLRDPPRAGVTDGIVPYSSSHLEGAGSELLIHGSHLCLGNPAVIEEVGRVSGNTQEPTFRCGPIAEALREMARSALHLERARLIQSTLVGAERMTHEPQMSVAPSGFGSSLQPPQPIFLVSPR